LGGDFAQIAPVIRHGNRAATVHASLQSSPLWPSFQQLTLTDNMRVLPGANNQAFATWLAQMSYDSNMYGPLIIPPYIQTYTQVSDLINFVYPPQLLEAAPMDFNIFNGRCILAFHNDTVGQFNSVILDSLPGEVHTFHRINTSHTNEDDPEIEHFPAEYLSSLDIAGLPPSQLLLTVGCPVILLRNLYLSEGLCNGTRMIVTHLGQHCIEVQILDGTFHGRHKLIPRIQLATLEGQLPFILTRKQFPIRLSFAMTVNKSQGQTLGVVGLDLRTSAFSHGQLYVAMSRVTDVANLSVLQNPPVPSPTLNIVYLEILLQ